LSYTSVGIVGIFPSTNENESVTLEYKTSPYIHHNNTFYCILCY